MKKYSCIIALSMIGFALISSAAPQQNEFRFRFTRTLEIGANSTLVSSEISKSFHSGRFACTISATLDPLRSITIASGQVLSIQVDKSRKDIHEQVNLVDPQSRSVVAQVECVRLHESSSFHNERWYLVSSESPNYLHVIRATLGAVPLVD